MATGRPVPAGLGQLHPPSPPIPRTPLLYLQALDEEYLKPLFGGRAEGRSGEGLLLPTDSEDQGMHEGVGHPAAYQELGIPTALLDGSAGPAAGALGDAEIQMRAPPGGGRGGGGG